MIKKILLIFITISLFGCETEKITGYEIVFKYPYVGSYNIIGESINGNDVSFKLSKHPVVKSEETINCLRVIFKTSNNRPITKNCLKDNNGNISLDFSLSDFDYYSQNEEIIIYFAIKDRDLFSINKTIKTTEFHIQKKYDGPKTRLLLKIQDFLRGLYAAR